MKQIMKYIKSANFLKHFEINVMGATPNLVVTGRLIITDKSRSDMKNILSTNYRQIIQSINRSLSGNSPNETIFYEANKD